MRESIRIAILISCLGLFSLPTFTAQGCNKEIGIPKVLGASVDSILTLLSKNFLKLVLIAIATPLAWYAMGQWLQISSTRPVGSGEYSRWRVDCMNRAADREFSSRESGAGKSGRNAAERKMCGTGVHYRTLPFGYEQLKIRDNGLRASNGSFNCWHPISLCNGNRFL